MKKFRIINIILISSIISIMLFETQMLTRAQVADDESATPDVSHVCADDITIFADKKRVEFAAFITTHFRSAKPTSDLISVAVERFRQYRKEVRDRVAQFRPGDGVSAEVAAAQISECQDAVEQDFTLMKELIRQHVVQNAYAKKSTRLLDAYKNINSQLERLNFTIAQMYGYFGTLSQKLPCYATQCVKR